MQCTMYVLHTCSLFINPLPMCSIKLDKQCTIFPDMSTESFAIIEEEKNNTTIGRIGNEILIWDKKANTQNRKNATDEKRNISINLRDAHELTQVRSGKDSKSARKNCGKVSHHCMLHVVQYTIHEFRVIPHHATHKIDIVSQIWIYTSIFVLLYK